VCGVDAGGRAVSGEGSDQHGSDPTAHRPPDPLWRPL